MFKNFRTVFALFAILAFVLVSCKDNSTDPSNMPTITSINPAIINSNDIVTISGSNFGSERDTNYVLFNGIKAIEYTSWSSTEIKVKAPAGISSGNVKVLVDGNTSNNFAYTLPKPTAPLGVRATSIDSITVKIAFDRSLSEDTVIFKKYIITVNGDSVNERTKTELKEVNIDKLANGTKLVQGTEYTLGVYALYTNGEKSDAVTVVWSPADYLGLTDAEQPVRLYENASSFGSGLRIYDPETGKPLPLKVTTSKADWNVGIEVANDEVTFGSANNVWLDKTESTYPASIDIITMGFVNNLSDWTRSANLNTGFVYGENSINLDQTPIPDGSIGKNIVICCKIPTATAGQVNYAKILFKRGSNDKFLQGDSPNRYLECVISYQKVVNKPYAK